MQAIWLVSAQVDLKWSSKMQRKYVLDFDANLDFGNFHDYMRLTTDDMDETRRRLLYGNANFS